ncbi:MAG TPA: Na+/H+ antiporter subunit A [Clostridia bacterium]|nr:Na+/H+ antiporter subunit A [Clostridia bacterium]
MLNFDLSDRGGCSLTGLCFVIFLPFLYTVLVPFFYRYFKRVHTGWFVLPVPLVLFWYLVSHLSLAQNPSLVSLSWIPSLDINITLYADGLAFLFGFLVTGIGALVVFYSIYYLSKEREELHNFYVYLLLFMGAMLGVVFSDNVMALYLFWELTSIASFLLIGFWYQRRRSRSGAQKALLITVFGGLALFAGLLILANIICSFSIRAMIGSAGAIAVHPLFLPAMVLVLLGAFTKSAQVPFFIWLPDAMEAPTPISAYLHSATMVKAGIYLIARLTPIFGGSFAWFWLVAGIGLLTLFWGSFSAVRQTDLKAMLAYSTISQLGMIICLFGLGSVALYYGPGEAAAPFVAALLAAVFHLFNHSIFKCCLFMVVGIIDHETGTRDVRKLGGLINIMPWTFTLAVIGSFSMAGLPPFSGFLSKEMFFAAVVAAAKAPIFSLDSLGIVFPVVAWVASIFTFVYCLILALKPFLGKHYPLKLEKKAHEAVYGMVVPPALLAVLVVALFFYPNPAADYLFLPVLASILPGFAAAGLEVEPISPWHGLTPELAMTLGVVALGTLLYLSVRRWGRLYGYLPARFSLNNLYEFLLINVEKAGGRVTAGYMTGSLGDYLRYNFAFFVLAVGGVTLARQGFAFDWNGNSPVSLYEVVLALALVGSAVLVLLAQKRLVALVGLGIMGYLVSVLFVVFRAPDLALTQVVVETVTTVMLLLCLYFLPEFKEEPGPLRGQTKNLIIALGVGGLVTAMALSAFSQRLFEPISWFYEDAYARAGAKNVVNAILVDFRGFDTMFEILVFTIAGLGVYTLIKLRRAGRER